MIYLEFDHYEIQIIGEGGCEVTDLCETHKDLRDALKAYKARKLHKSEFPAVFNLHPSLAKDGGRPVETPGVEKNLVICGETPDGDDYEIVLMSEFI